MLGLGSGLFQTALRRIGGGGAGFTPLAVGFSSSNNEGTTGDLYVSKSGNDSNPGTFASPKLTISGALSAATAGQEIKVRAGIYRETVDFTGKGGSSGNRTTISRYGSEEVIISAAEPLTGFAACTIADEPDVGANWAEMFKVTVPLSTFPGSDPRAAHPYEDGVRLYPATEWLPNPQYPGQQEVTSQWHTADVAVLSGPNIVGLQHPAVTDNYTQAQIENADVFFMAQPNVSRRTPVASFTSGTINLTDTTGLYENNDYKDSYSLINMLPAMKKGQWGFKISGSDAIIYVWPNNPATINTAIEVTARGKCFDATAVSHVEIRGLIIERASSNGASTDGLYAYSALGLTRRAGHVIENCLFRENYRGSRDYSPISMGLIDDYRIERITVDGAYGQRGLFLSGSSWDLSGMAVGGRILYNEFKNCDNTPMSLFGQENCVVAFNRAYNCGLAAHANKTSAYQSSHRVTYWGNDFSGSSGYATWQQCSSIVFGFNDIPVNYNGDDGRAIVDQNSATAGFQSPATEQGIDGTSYILNNMAAPFVEAIANVNSLVITQEIDTAVVYAGKNNILHGADVDETLLITNGWRNNLFTSGSVLASSAGTDTTAAWADIYTDQSKGDVSIKAGSPTRSASTASIAAEVAVLQGWYPDVADIFTKDANGTTFDPSAPPMGPYLEPDNAPALPPIWIRRPEVQGVLVLGETLSLTDGYVIGRPWPSRTYQWVVSDDLHQWEDISGATSATYVIQSGDVGRYVGCRITAGGVSSVVAAQTSLVIASFPIADPVLLAYLETTSGASSSKELKTLPFTTSDKPIIVVASQRSSANSNATLTVTLGNSDRAFGTGTPVTFAARSRRTSNESQLFFLIAPGAAADQTIHVSSSLTTFGTQVAVFEVDGLTGIGATASGGASTTTSSASSVTTLNDSSGVLHVFNRFDGRDDTNPITLSGCDQISNGNTGGVSPTADLTIAIGYEQAVAAATAYGASATWPTGAAVTWLSAELLS